MFKRKLVQVFSYFPLKLNFFILSFVIGLVFYWSKQNFFVKDDTSIFYLLLKALATILFIFSGLIFSISVITVVLAWAHYLLIKRSTTTPLLKIKFGEGNHSNAGLIPLELTLFSVIRPFLGIIKTRLLFEDLLMTEDLVLNRNYKIENKLFRDAIVGTNYIKLHDRKEYNLLKIFIFFEDIFRLFSFPYIERGEKLMYVTPPNMKLQALEILPNKSEEQEQRILLPKKIQGEYVNYKSFEAGDDIRRIVWKIYAKNKELVIRIPEVTDPYASHIYFYSSFYNALGDKLSSSFDHEFLNFFKDKVRNIYDSIAENGFEMRYKSDQDLNITSGMDNHDTVIYQVTSSRWHKNVTVNDLFGKVADGVLVISSLTSTKDLAQALENKQAGTYIILVKLSELFNHRSPISIKSIFFRSPETAITTLKRNWMISGYKRRVLKNEKELTNMINNQIFN